MSPHEFTHWRKAHASGSNGQGGCVEIGQAAGVRGIRDATLGEASPILTVSDGTFDALVAAVESGTLRSRADLGTVRDPDRKHQPVVRQALKATADTAVWTTITGPAGDSVRVTFSRHNADHYVLLRDDRGLEVVFDSYEWLCFSDGVRNREFSRQP